MSEERPESEELNIERGSSVVSDKAPLIVTGGDGFLGGRVLFGIFAQIAEGGLVVY